MVALDGDAFLGPVVTGGFDDDAFGAEAVDALGGAAGRGTRGGDTSGSGRAKGPLSGGLAALSQAIGGGASDG